MISAADHPFRHSSTPTHLPTYPPTHLPTYPPTHLPTYPRTLSAHFMTPSATLQEESMNASLKGKKIAILATDGVEQVELEKPRQALDAAGAVTHLIAPKAGTIQAMNHDDKGARLKVDRVLGEVKPSEYDA